MGGWTGEGKEETQEAAAALLINKLTTIKRIEVFAGDFSLLRYYF